MNIVFHLISPFYLFEASTKGTQRCCVLMYHFITVMIQMHDRNHSLLLLPTEIFIIIEVMNRRLYGKN